MVGHEWDSQVGAQTYVLGRDQSGKENRKTGVGDS